MISTAAWFIFSRRSPKPNATRGTRDSPILGYQAWFIAARWTVGETYLDDGTLAEELAGVSVAFFRWRHDGRRNQPLDQRHLCIY